MKLQITRTYWSSLPPIEVEIGAEFESSSSEIKLGAAVKVAFRSGAVLRYADLFDADLRYADLRYADLNGAVLRGADLRYANLSDVPKIEDLDAKIVAAIECGGKLDMNHWHTCKTTHCRAGWAITLAGEDGIALEKKFGSAAAGALIYAKSTPDAKIPNFYASTKEAMEDLLKRAGR